MLKLFILAICFGIVLYTLVPMYVLSFSHRLPEDVIKKLAEVEETTRAGEGYGDSAISRLDDLMTEAESRQPGSTLGLYIQQPQNKFLMAVGSLVYAFIIVGWIIEKHSFGLLNILGFIIGVFFLTAPLFQWQISHPRPFRK